MSKSKHNIAVSVEDTVIISHYASLLANNDIVESIATEQLRQQAKQSLLTKGLPTKKDEQWQYTALDSWKKILFDYSQGGGGNLQDLASFLPSFASFKLIFVDGVLNQKLSDNLTNLPKGCKVVIDDKNPRLPSSQEPFINLFTLTCKQTIVIEVDAKAMLELPLHLVQVTTQQSIEATGLAINVGESAQCKIVQQLVSLNGQAKFHNGYAAINIAKNALCEQFVVQNLNKNSFYFNNQVINQAEKSTFKSHYINLGSAVARHENIVIFAGEYCEAYQSSVVLGNETQVADSRTVTNHNLPNCESYQLHKFVLDDYARGVFNGMIYVAPDAQKTNGNMDNRNLLLSNNAKMDTKPQLEIYADDVLCSHGCTSGQIDKNQLFYCQSRGIRKADARALITRAFVLEPLDSINNLEIKQWLVELIKQKLDKEN